MCYKILGKINFLNVINKSSLFRSFRNSSNISSFDFVFFGLAEPLHFWAISHSLILCSYLNYIFHGLSTNLRHWSFEMCLTFFYFHHFIQETLLRKFSRSMFFILFKQIFSFINAQLACPFFTRTKTSANLLMPTFFVLSIIVPRFFA